MTKTVTKNKVRSVEPLIADLANGWMKSYNLDYKLEQEPLNTEIDKALDEYLSKSGGKEEIDLTQNCCYKIKTSTIGPFLSNTKAIRVSLKNSTLAGTLTT